MRLFLSTLVLMLCSCFIVAQEKYNVVIINCDDLGYGDLACYGNKLHRTPNIDRLAKEGAQFSSFYVAQPVCSASRAALLTGCYPNRIGILGALHHKSTNGINQRETTFAELLQGQGYSTAMFGKWHLGHHPNFSPIRHGFLECAGIPYSNDMWPRNLNAKNNTYPELPWFEAETNVEGNPDQTQFTTRLTKRVTDFITKTAGTPFMVYLAHPMPHVPLHVAAERAGKSAGGMYGDVIEEIDWSVGEILSALQKSRVDDKTLVIFTSDNGPWLSFGNHAGTTGGLREGKGTTFEGGVRVPFLARLPGVIPAGHRCDQPAMTIDLLPTLAHLAKAPLPALSIDGKNIWPLFVDAKAVSPHDALYFYWNQELQAVRSGPWKLHLPHSYRTLKAAGGKDGQPAAYENVKLELSLYNLLGDPNETTNLVEKEPAVVAALMKHVETAREELGDSLTKREGKGIRKPGMVEGTQR
jgi:arylsulfatase A